MIIQKINSRSDYKSSQIKRNKSFKNSIISIQTKNIDSRDFLYHTPTFPKSTISFKGENAATHPISFEESIKLYFALPKDQTPDQKQIDAARVIYRGNHAITVLPTGTGKTLIAEYAIRKNMAENKATCFTFPTKALANEKYRDFCKKFGKENVGLLTGDIKLNSQAPIKIMIEEVYANAVLGNNEMLHNLATVIHDEFHTINDYQRGIVYEKAVMFTPPHVQQILLSGTVGNGQELATWINKIEAKKVAALGGNIPVKKAELVEMASSDRYVPLKHFVYHQGEFVPLISEEYNLDKLIDLSQNNLLSERQKEVLSQIGKLAHGEENPEKGLEYLKEILQNKNQGDLEYLEEILEEKLQIKLPEAQRFAAFLSDPSKKRFNEAQLSKEALKESAANVLRKGKIFKSGILDLIENLQEQDKFPAIIFKLSQSGCDKLQEDAYSSGLNLLTEEEREKVSKIITEFKKDHYLGVNFNEEAVLKGFTTHHAGMTPDAKELTEILAENKLIKVVYATGTLDRGINFPIRTVIVQEYDRVVGKTKDGNTIYKELSINDLHQEFGRSGRRGKDPIGYVFHVPNKRYSPFDIYKKVIASADNIVSRIRPEYNFISQIMMKNGFKGLEDTLDMSFLAMDSARTSQVKALKEKFKQYARWLLKMGMIQSSQESTGKFILTPEGSIVLKARGVDGLFFSKIFFDLPLDELKPSHLAALACYLSEGDYKDDATTIKGVNINLTADKQSKSNKKSNGTPKSSIILDKEMVTFLQRLEKLKKLIKKFEVQPKTPNILAMQFIQKWAESSDGDNIYNWKSLFTSKINPALSEGALFEAVNRSADILKQMIENADFLASQIKNEILKTKMERILQNAQQAWLAIKKPPVLDVALDLALKSAK